MLTRRFLLAGTAAVALMARLPAHAQADATGFVQRLGEQLIGIVNAPGSAAAKRQQLAPLIDAAVDVDGIGRFCLGRFARTATPQQLTDFLHLFHEVLLSNITGKLGQFQGVTFTMTQTAQREGESFVGSTIKRPNEQPNNVQWVVSTSTGQPKIVDVIAEGTSLRQTQRSDYAAFLSGHNNNVDALLNAMRRQASA